MNLDELLAQMTDGAENIPAQLAELDAGALDQLADELVTRFEELSSGTLDSATIATMEALADGRDLIRAETTRRDTEAAAAAEKVAELAQRINGGPGDEDEDDGGDDTDNGGGSTTSEPSSPAVPSATAPGGEDPDDDGSGDGGGVDPDPAVPQRELVNASGRKSGVNLGAIRSKARPVRLGTARASLIAAADIPGVPTGSRLDMAGMVRAAEARFAGFPQQRVANRFSQTGIATIARPFPATLTQSRSGGDDDELMERAADQTRLPGNSLLAAGGWCAPSETVYDLCEPEQIDGIASVPEIGIKRGGIRFAVSPLFSDIYDGTGFTQTEAQNIAGVEKDAYEIGCPSFDEVRLDAIGVQITAGILQQRGYPEMVARVIRGALTAHAHKVNAFVIAKMAALSTAVAAGSYGFGAFADTLAAMELQVVDVRYKYRLAETSTLEMIAPQWLKPIFRADLAVRNSGGDQLITVTDAQLDQFFRSRGVSVQWVKDWQDAYVNVGHTGIGGATPATAFPLTGAKVMLYPAGTFTKGVADIISLDAIYDSTNIKTNSYTALFTEEAVLVAKRCMESRIVTLPELCPAGRTGAAVEVDCTP